MRTVKIAGAYALLLQKLLAHSSFPKKLKKLSYYLLLSFHATCNVASDIRSRDFGCKKDLKGYGERGMSNLFPLDLLFSNLTTAAVRTRCLGFGMWKLIRQSIFSESMCHPAFRV